MKRCVITVVAIALLALAGYLLAKFDNPGKVNVKQTYRTPWP